MSDIKLKSIVSKQIPEFVRSDYPVFVEFLKAYYEYLDQHERRDLLKIRDIDNTLDEFVEYFKRELNVLGGSGFPYINEKLFLRKIKPLFKSKGTESAYKFLFKVLYNKPADISYPWDSVLKASDGRWNQEMSLFIEISAGDANTLPGNRIPIIGPNVSINVFVTRVKHVQNGTYEVFIDKNYFGQIETNYTINFNGIVGQIIPTTVKSEIIRRGEGFKIGDLIEGTTISGGTTITQLLKVTRVDENGGITGIVNISFGAGYENDFFLLTSKARVNVNRSSFTLDKNTTRQYSLPDDSFIEKYQEYGYAVNPNYASPIYSDTTYVGTLIQQFFEETGIGESEETNFALIKFDIGAVAKYQGYYSTNDGFLDDDMFIQDSRFYQKYSYLITVDESLDKYKTIAKSYLHPAGTALFGEYQIQNNFVAGIEGSIELAKWVSKATFTLIEFDIPTDYTYASDLGGLIKIEPYDSEFYVIPTEDYNPPGMLTFYGDGRNVLSSPVVTISDGDFTGTLGDEIGETVTVTSDEQDINLNTLTLNGGTVDMNATSIPTVDLQNDIGTNDLLGL